MTHARSFPGMNRLSDPIRELTSQSGLENMPTISDNINYIDSISITIKTY